MTPPITFSFVAGLMHLDPAVVEAVRSRPGVFMSETNNPGNFREITVLTSLQQKQAHRLWQEPVPVDGYLDVIEDQGLRPRLSAMLVIFLVSLFASSFPSASKRVAFLRIPRIVFFIGKHFGTGVILSTAFVHLLQDAFASLRDPLVLARWNVGDYVGLIALGSLLSIFLIEYISTSYVDRLQSYSSPPTSPKSTPTVETPPTPPHISRPRTPKHINGTNSEPYSNERAALVHSSSKSPRRARSFPYGTFGHEHHSATADSYFFEGHHRHESRGAHEAHHDRGPRLPVIYGPEEFGQGRVAGVGHVHDREALTGHGHSHDIDGGDEEPGGDGAGREACSENGEVRLGKKRQIVGILVLQLGIMIHSMVIGLTLSITSGPEFTSLFVAIIFHQLFEGLSLGIRIASLPSSQDTEFKYLAVLKPVLAVLFAITTPVGILLGLLIFSRGDDGLHMRLTQGLMSAISAGMLIYAACVEMLAGDFVMDPILWRSGLGKQALALVSLTAGVGAMAAVG
ncbi:Zinc/iron permease [Leucogyrophana mollusca]|uniref:Zinc/iron permease n=1 Tax=Leucogyrophana mollusca TaxID=85980 RepID=A0ACB8B9P9_9AGAM|nr:Zinc/iron permease [Leucogyrophana mollusca]